MNSKSGQLDDPSAVDDTILNIHRPMDPNWRLVNEMQTLKRAKVILNIHRPMGPN